MNKKATQAQETSFRMLYSGDLASRERVLAIQRPEMQEMLRNLIKAKSNTDKLLAILFSDLKRASGEMKANPEDQFWRRITIRSLAATLDGIVFCLKEIALATGPMNGFKFTDKELFFLTEKVVKSDATVKNKFLSFRDNIKETFKFFSKIHKTSCSVDFQNDGFSALCETYELRNRLVHPKHFMTFCVSNIERESWPSHPVVRY